MALSEWVLCRVSLRGDRCGCSPMPTNATRLVQNSIFAQLRSGSRQGNGCVCPVWGRGGGMLHPHPKLLAPDGTQR